MKNIKKYKSFLLSVIIILVVICIDRKTKNIVLKTIPVVIKKNIGLKIKITSFLNIVLVWNNGISFGIFNGSKIIPSVILLIATCIACYLIYFICRTKKFTDRIFLSFIIGGAIGNILDRVTYGAVVDFIDLHIGQYHWPAFNIADSSIFIGVSLYLLYDIMNTKKHRQK